MKKPFYFIDQYRIGLMRHSSTWALINWRRFPTKDDINLMSCYLEEQFSCCIQPNITIFGKPRTVLITIWLSSANAFCFLIYYRSSDFSSKMALFLHFGIIEMIPLQSSKQIILFFQLSFGRKINHLTFKFYIEIITIFPILIKKPIKSTQTVGLIRTNRMNVMATTWNEIAYFIHH